MRNLSTPHTATTDQEIWQKIKSGDELVFMKVYNTNYKHLFIFGYGICKDSDIVKDHIHELFCELWEKRSSLTISSNIKAYLFTCLKRKIIKHLKPANTSILTAEAVLPSVEEEIILKQTNQENTVKLVKAFKLLSPTQREIINLKYYEGLSYEEIAVRLNNKPRTVYNQVHDALKRLRSSLKIFF